MAVALINAQAYIYAEMAVPVATRPATARCSTRVTGTMVAHARGRPRVHGVAAFRYLGGRTADREIVAANAVFWYFLAAAFSAVWLIVYVTK